VALLGPNGAGKTTFLRILASLSRPFLGRSALPGTACQANRRRCAATGRGLAHAPALRRPDRRGKPAILRPHVHPAHLLRALRKCWKWSAWKRAAATWCARFSRGMQQRLAIGRAVLHDPEVMLFDEPYTGLDQDASVHAGWRACAGCRSGPHGGDDLPRPGARRRPGQPFRHPFTRRDRGFASRARDLGKGNLLDFYKQVLRMRRWQPPDNPAQRPAKIISGKAIGRRLERPGRRTAFARAALGHAGFCAAGHPDLQLSPSNWTSPRANRSLPACCGSPLPLPARSA
jgi:hypothetical protein